MRRSGYNAGYLTVLNQGAPVWQAYERVSVCAKGEGRLAKYCSRVDLNDNDN